jgi:hypothetical protein
MKGKCQICGTNTANMEKHLLSKKHLNLVQKIEESNKLKDYMKYILQNRDDLPSVEEIITDCDITDSHDIFVTNAIVEFLSIKKQEFTITDENVEITADEHLN